MQNFSKFVGMVKAGRLSGTDRQKYIHKDRGYLIGPYRSKMILVSKIELQDNRKKLQIFLENDSAQNETHILAGSVPLMCLVSHILPWDHR